MAKEPDVARVAAAFNAPGLKYRSFGNMPVRNDAPRGEVAAQDPDAVLREIRSASAAARQVGIDAALQAAPPLPEPEAPTVTIVSSVSAEVSEPVALAESVIAAPVVAAPPPAPVVEAPPVVAAPSIVAVAPPLPIAAPVRPAPPIVTVASPAPLPEPVAIVAPQPRAAQLAEPSPPRPAPAAPLPELAVVAAPLPPAPPVAAAPPPPRLVPVPVPLVAVAPASPPPELPVVAPIAMEPRPTLAPLPPSVPVPEPGPEPAIDWAALASASRPAPPVIREAEIAAFSVSEPVHAAPAVPEFSLLDAIGLIPEPSPAPPPSQAGGTLARLRSQIAGSAEQPLPSPAYQAAPTGLLSTPPPGPSAGEGIVPASAVTVSLGEVMRLIAAGNPPAASPIDTFRAALRSSSPF